MSARSAPIPGAQNAERRIRLAWRNPRERVKYRGAGEGTSAGLHRSGAGSTGIGITISLKEQSTVFSILRKGTSVAALILTLSSRVPRTTPPGFLRRRTVRGASVTILFSDRSIWTMAHGIVLGGAALMGLAAALFALCAMRA